MTLRSSRTLPSGRTAISVAPAPARSTNGQRQASPSTAVAAVAMTMISIVAQPTFWAMLSRVGTTEPRRPTSPRSDTMAGAPVVAPNIAEAPSSSAPRPQPTTMARMARPTEPVVVATRAPVSGPNRLIPRLPHIASWSTKPSGRGGSVVRVSGASAAPVRGVVSGGRRSERRADIDAAPYAGITRSGSVGRRARVRTPPSQPTTGCELPMRLSRHGSTGATHDLVVLGARQVPGGLPG